MESSISTLPFTDPADMHYRAMKLDYINVDVGECPPARFLCPSAATGRTGNMKGGMLEIFSLHKLEFI